MDPSALNSLLLAALTGALGVIGTLLFRKDDRQQASATRTDDRVMQAGIDLSALHANVNMLMSERNKYEALGERLARAEGWQETHGPRINEAYEGLRAVARLDERMRTVFSKLEEISAKLSGAPRAPA